MFNMIPVNTTIKDLWKSALAEIELSLSKASFVTWFKYTAIIRQEDDGLIIVGVPNGFSKEWLENKYNKLILKSLKNIDKDIRDVKFEITGAMTFANDKTTDNKSEKKSDNDQLWLINKQNNTGNNINPKYTFNSFIVGTSNELAYAASLAVTKNLGKTYNPLLIYGGTGLGKTHLLQAIGNEVLSKFPGKKIKYLSSEKFTNEFIDALKNKDTNTFKDKYRKADVLIIDDVQFLANKEQTQEEFFHTFNELHEKNKQIILSSDQPPRSITTINDRLRSRFEGGMIADIGTPDYETRMAILKTKLEESSRELDERIINYIASNITSNIRELEGALNKVLAMREINNILPDEKLSKILSEFLVSPERLINPTRVIKEISQFYDINPEDLRARNRKKTIVKARQIIMYILREELNYSYSDIGEKFGGRDHTTVLHACGKISNEISKNGELLKELSLIRERLHINR